MAHAQSWHVLPAHQWQQVLPADRKKLSRICRQHGALSRPLAADFLREFKTGYSFEADQRLRTFDRALQIGDTGLSATVSDKELKRWCEDMAEALAGRCDSLTRAGHIEQAISYAQKVVNDCGLSFPVTVKGRNPVNEGGAVNGEIPVEAVEAADWGAALARVFDPQWWRRQIRRVQALKIETVAREIRLVSASAGIYASDMTVTRRKQQRERNRDTLDQLEAANEAGEAVALAECVAASTSNPVNRRHELMTRMRGFEECAEAAGHVGLFTTITTPSRFHAMNLNRKTQKAYRNPKYDGSTPREAQSYLCGVWSRVRAELWRAGARPYGFRVAEPHHDGTPHWHMMLFVEPDQLDTVEAIIDRYALEEDADELIGLSKDVRSKHVRIDPAQGTASGYIAKYISKNIDGAHVEADHYGRDAKVSAQRIEAWASAWRIRQFQQIGGASVTVWRELRRLQFEQASDQGRLMASMSLDERERFLDAWRAADSSDWAAYTMLQGGMTVRRDEQYIRSHYVPDGRNKYHEKTARLSGVLAAGAAVCTRAIRWTIQAAGTAVKLLTKDEQPGGHRVRANGERAEAWARHYGEPVSVVFSTSGERTDALRVERAEVTTAGGVFNHLQFIGGRSLPTWTCVSNCTA